MIRPVGDEPLEPTEGPKVLFEPGQLVRHRHYRYRGVVVACDPCCRADEAWYTANQTQPNRDQPWYHVLVHNSDHATYPAQDNLLPDTSGQPIRHPLLTTFFADFLVDGKYIRNDLPWSV